MNEAVRPDDLIDSVAAGFASAVEQGEDRIAEALVLLAVALAEYERKEADA